MTIGEAALAVVEDGARTCGGESTLRLVGESVLGDVGFGKWCCCCDNAGSGVVGELTVTRGTSFLWRREPSGPSELSSIWTRFEGIVKHGDESSRPN